MNLAEKPSINGISITLLRNDAHFQLNSEFLNLVIKTTPAALKLDSALWAEYVQRYHTLDATLKKITMSALTEKIKAADDARDDVFAGLVKFQKMSLEHYEPETRDAARKIDVVFHSYGNIAAKPINEETSAIFNFVQELKSDTYKNLVTLTGLMPWVNKLAQKNEEFESLIQERDRESAAKTQVAVKTARHSVDEAYRYVVKTINAMIHLGTLTECAAFVDTMNAVIKRYAVMIHQPHGNHNKNTPNAETEGEGENTTA